MAFNQSWTLCARVTCTREEDPICPRPLELCTGVAKAMGTYVEPTRRVVCGEWVSPHLAGGCPNHVTWRDNPQYVLSLSRNLAVFAP